VPKKVYFPEIWPFFSRKRNIAKELFLKIILLFSFWKKFAPKFKNKIKIASPKKQRQSSNGI